MATILLLLDAFRYDYLTEEATPFLWQCAQEGEYYAGVEPSFGFCERAEVLTGLRGDESGFLTGIGFDPINSPFYNFPMLSHFDTLERFFLRFHHLLPSAISSRVNKKFRDLVSNCFRKQGMPMSSYFIPFSWLPYFALTEDRLDHRDPAAFSIPSILTLLEEAGMTYCYDTFTALGFNSPFKTDCDRLNGVVSDAMETVKDLYLVYIAAPDTFGHIYGPTSHDLREVLHRLDKDLENFVQNLERIAPGNRYLFLGDHGMLPVQLRIDAEKEIDRLLVSNGLRKGRDLIYFLDSTMVRLWILSDKAHHLLPAALTTSEIFYKRGSWMDVASAKRFQIPWPDRRYGDHLWVANPGVLVFPDFFHRFSPFKGMHGYDPQHSQSQGMCINWGKGITPRKHPVIQLARVFELLKMNLKL
jgi:predicted AlkP superfamily pyrophosphatase or phosphodiesterase